jgi:histidinol dehydrogenase
VDLLPGPSELMVIADDTAEPAFAASDLLAQAEHGSGREKILSCRDPPSPFSKGILAEIRLQIKSLSRGARIQPVLDQGFLAVEVSSLAQAAEVANQVAPEHLELLVSESAQKNLLKQVTTAGAVMLGNYTPTALGDFTAGPSHVLPTGRAGRFFSGLRVDDFMRRTSMIHYDKAALKKAAPVVGAFAQMEQLDAHGLSVSLRLR